jgi:hypothetical protein
LILISCFHFTIHVIADAFVFSVPILFHNASLHFVCPSTSHFSAESPLVHLNCDVLGQWLPRNSHGICRVANHKIMLMHKDPMVCSKKLNEIEIVALFSTRKELKKL